MIGILWLIRYACSGLHFGDPAAKTAQAQQQQQGQAQQYAQQQQQLAQMQLQQYLGQNPNPFLGASIQRPQSMGGMTTGLPTGGGMMSPIGQFMGGQIQPTPGGVVGGAGSAVVPPGGPQGGAIDRPRLPGGGGGPGMHTMPNQFTLPPGTPSTMQGIQNALFRPGAWQPAGISTGNERKGSYGNLL